MSKAYQVFSYDAFVAPSERSDMLRGEFDCVEDADAFARKLIDDAIKADIESGKSLKEAIDIYRGFGEIPFVIGDKKSAFSPYEYMDGLLGK